MPLVKHHGSWDSGQVELVNWTGFTKQTNGHCNLLLTFILHMDRLRAAVREPAVETRAGTAVREPAVETERGQL